MELNDILDLYPKTITLKDRSLLTVRPLQSTDEAEFHKFFLVVPETERLLFRHRVTDPAVIHDWCQSIDYGKNLPLLALDGKKIIADASLHQTLGGWKRHVGRISVVVIPTYRGKGLAKQLVGELVRMARDIGLEKLEAEFMGEQQAARRVFAECGFSELLSLPDYLKDMQTLTHDYVLMGRNLVTDEEYAGAQ